MTTLSDARVATSSGELPPGLRARLEAVDVTLALDEIGLCRLELSDAAAEGWGWLERFEGAEPLVVALGPASEQTVVFDGEVVGLEVQLDEDGARRCTVRAMERSHRLWLVDPPAARTGTRLAELVGELASAAGLSGRLEDADATVQEWTSWGWTPGDQLRALCARHGCRLQTDGAEVRVVRDGPGQDVCAELTWGADLERFESRRSTARVGSSVRVLGWDRLRRQPIEAEAGEGAELDGTEGDQAASAAAKEGFGQAEWISSDLPVRSPDEARRLAGSLLTRQSHLYVQAEAVVAGLAGARPGGAVRVTGVAPQDDGVYRLAEVRHRFDRAGFRSTLSLTRSGSGEGP